ncbi:MAG: hypothetical protein R3324_01545 [Halobacteriales archaeon]|nr:hypothetical protein [Halobacteriales archaeon]
MSALVDSAVVMIMSAIIFGVTALMFNVWSTGTVGAIILTVFALSLLGMVLAPLWGVYRYLRAYIDRRAETRIHGGEP